MLDKTINTHWSNTSAAYNRWAEVHMRPGVVRSVWLDLLRGWTGDSPRRVLDVGTGPGILAF